LGLISRVIVLISVILVSNFFTEKIWIFGLLYGFSIGLCAVSSNIIGSKIFEKSLERLISLNSAIGGAVNIFVPVISAFLIIRFGYTPILIVAAPFLIAAWLFVTQIKGIKFGDGRFTLLKVGNTSENNLIWLTQFVEGLKGGFLWAYGGILAYTFVGGLAQWGVYNLVFSLLSIVVSLVLAKSFQLHLNKFFVVTVGLFYSIACLFLGANLGLIFFIYYSFVLIFVSAVGWSSFWGTINKMMSLNSDFEKYRIEYYVASELPLAIGRITPLLIIYAFRVHQFSDLVMRLSWVLIGLVPIISFSLLNKSQTWRE
jgi:MFS family permease